MLGEQPLVFIYRNKVSIYLVEVFAVLQGRFPCVVKDKNVNFDAVFSGREGTSDCKFTVSLSFVGL